MVAKPLKIEQLNLQSLVAAGLSAGKNPQQIAEECSRKAKTPISNMAVRRYLEATEGGLIAGQPVTSSATIPMSQKKAVTVRDPDRVARLVNRDIDLIELQYKTTQALAQRFDWVLELPEMFENRMIQIQRQLSEQKGSELDVETLAHWRIGFVQELARNVQQVAVLNRELRENGKFMASLREKAFEFSLIQEYLGVFMDIFKRINAEAYETAEAEIAANPRLQRIVEQQQQMRGFDEG